MTAAERDAVRLFRDRARRRAMGLPISDPGHGYTSKYRRGCRCDSCRDAATEARRRRRERQIERALTVDRSSPRWKRIRAHIAACSDRVNADEQADRVLIAIQTR